jgi:methylated-DNA-[protein]-cysteine S-methyltransferase
MRLLLDRIPSPIGEILLVHDHEGRLRALDFHDYEARMHRLLRLHYRAVDLAPAAAPATTVDGLHAYFGGDRGALQGLRVETGGTPFQRSVWAALRTIPSGSTTTYGDLAARIGNPKAVRAVGLANGANPVAIVVPCHRVIGSSGGLTGFGGGLHRKQWLLEHEGAIARDATLALQVGAGG